jgi:hypothetical protein
VSARSPSVPIAEAAALAGVEISQIRSWAAIDGLEIRRRGVIETVPLDEVMALSATQRRRVSRSSRSALRARLADAAVRNPSVSGLQQAARDQNDGADR